MERQDMIAAGHLLLIAKIAAAVVSYGFVLLLGRLLSQADFGLVGVLLNLSILVSVAGSAGQWLALVRIVPGLRAAQDWPAIGRLIAASARLVALAGGGAILTAATLLAVAPLLGADLRLAPATLLTMCLLFAAMLWADWQAALARGMQRQLLGLAPKELGWRLVAGAALQALAAAGGDGGGHPGLSLVLGVLAGSLVAVTAVQTVLLARRWPVAAAAGAAARADEGAPWAAEWRALRRPFWISSVANIFLANVDVVIVGLILGAEPVALYYAANRLTLFLAFPQISNNMVVGPELARAWSEGRRDRIAAIAVASARRALWPTLPAALALVLLAPVILSFFGPAYAAASGILICLTLATLVNTALGPSDIVLNMCGAERAAMAVGLVSLGFSCLAIAAGAFLHGGSGAAMGVLAAMLLRKVLYAAALGRQLGMRADVLGARERLDARGAA